MTKISEYILNKTQHTQTYFWGASLLLQKRILPKLNLSKCKIAGIIDNDKNKAGKTLGGLKIFSSLDVEKLRPKQIIITTTNHPNLFQDIRAILKEKNIECKVLNLNNDDLIDLNESDYIGMSNTEKLKYIIKIANCTKSYVSTINSMLLSEEKLMLHLLAKYYYKGEGSIFDAGIFLGGCTEAFLNGLHQNNLVKPNKQIWAYEYGLCCTNDKEMNSNNFYFKYLQQCYPDKTITNDFSGLVIQNLKNLNYENYFTLHLGDINKKTYPPKIEIMFLDVCKSSDTNFTMQKLFRRLIPGRSIVIQQDYIFNGCPWIRVTMGYLKDYFEYVGCTQINSMVFLLKKEIPPEVLNINPYNTFSYSELEKMHNFYNKYLTKEQETLVLQALQIMQKDNLSYRQL